MHSPYERATNREDRMVDHARMHTSSKNRTRHVHDHETPQCTNRLSVYIQILTR